MKLRIVLLPDSDTSTLVKGHSAILSAELPTFFMLDNQHIPHVTIVHIEIDEDHLKNISVMIHKVAQQEKIINVETDKGKADENDASFIGVYFKEDKDIVSIRDKIFVAIKDKIIDSSTFHKPHITLTRLQNEENAKTALQVLHNSPQVNVVLSRIAICDSQANGTASKVFASFSLK